MKLLTNFHYLYSELIRMIMENVNVVTLVRFDSLGEAEIVKGLLESNGVNCELMHETIQTVLPYLTSGVDPIELVVAEPDVERAREILAAKFDQQEFDDLSKSKKRCSCKKP